VAAALDVVGEGGHGEDGEGESGDEAFHVDSFRLGG
jgi:hypothetical protein